MRNKILLLTLLITTSFGIWDETRYHDQNRWLLWLSNFGEWGQNMFSGPGGEWPRGSGHRMIYGAGIWIGAIRPAGDTFVSVGYDPHSGASEFVPGALPNEPGYPDTTEHVYLSTQPNFPVLPRSNQDSWCIFNEFDTTFHSIDSIPSRKPRRPLGVSVVQRTYTYTDPKAEDIVFLEYTMANDTNYTIRQMYSAIGSDPDVGNFTTDILIFKLARKLWACMDYVPTSDLVGIRLLSPLPISSFKSFTIDIDPPNDTARYLSMAGYDYRTGIYEPYDSIDPGPADKRCLFTVGPFNLAPRESLKVWWALIGAKYYWVDSFDLFRKADYAQWLFDHNFPQHQLTLSRPNGGEYLAGQEWIKWRAQSGTGYPMLIDLYLSPDLGKTWTRSLSISQTVIHFYGIR